MKSERLGEEDVLLYRDGQGARRCQCLRANVGLNFLLPVGILCSHRDVCRMVLRRKWHIAFLAQRDRTNSRRSCKGALPASAPDRRGIENSCSEFASAEGADERKLGPAIVKDKTCATLPKLAIDGGAEFARQADRHRGEFLEVDCPTIQHPITFTGR